MQVDIQAYYLLYSRIEAEYSSRRRSGYQTVFNSSQLGDPQVREIENNVQCFRPASDLAARRQYFIMSDQRFVVVTHSRVIKDPPAEIIDKNRREGAFLANCFVIPMEDFQRVYFDPFAILNAADEWRISNPNQIPDLVAGGEVAQSRQVLRLRVNVPNPNVPQEVNLESWQQGEYLKLINLASSARRIMSSNQSVMFIGSAGRVAGELETLFKLLDPESRLHCTFDTNADNCNPVPGRIWAVGQERRTTNRNFLNVNLDNNVVEAEVASDTDPKGLYHNGWLMPLIASSSAGLSQILHMAPAVQRAAMVFERKMPILPHEGNDYAPQGFQSFIRGQQGLFNDGLNQALSPLIGSKNAELLLVVIGQLGVPDPVLLNMAGMQNLAFHNVDYRASFCNTLIGWLERFPSVIGQVKWKDFTPLSQQVMHPTFSFFVAAYNNREAEAQATLEALLSRADLMSYQDLLYKHPNLIAGVNPSYLIHYRVMPELAQWAAQQRWQDEDLITEFFIKFIENRGERLVGQFAHHLRVITRKKNVKNLQKVVQSVPGIDPNFIATVNRFQ